MPSSTDPFDEILNLEDNFYSEGYAKGMADGARAGLIEGRSFGIEKGFEKFVEAGRLYGKAVVWANRLPQQQQQQQQQRTTSTTAESGNSTATTPSCSLPTLGKSGQRLEKNILTLHALVERDTLSTENSDDAVNDFDDRVKRAQGKARVIERNLGEESGGVGGDAAKTETGTVASVAESGENGEPSLSAAVPSTATVEPGLQF